MNIEYGRIVKAPRFLNVKRWNIDDSRSTIKIPNDTFEKTKEDNMTSNDNLKFQKVKIQFYPEDVERMKNMSLEERIAFKQELKAQNRYTQVDSSEE